MADKINTPEMLNSKMDRTGRGTDSMSFINKIILGSSHLFGATGMAGNSDLVIVDMSYWQDDKLIDYDLLCANADAFILRVSYGIWRDTRFPIHYENIARRGKPIGGYAYTIGNQSAVEQARTYYNAIKGLEMSASNWHDVEDRRPGTHLTRTVVETFTKALDDLIGKAIDFYTGVYAWYDIMKGGGFGDRLLWLANYGVLTPRMPIGGDWKDFFLWQYTESGRLPGYGRNLDLNRVNATKEEFNKWVCGVDIPEKPPEEQKVLFKAKCITGTLNVRRGAGTSHAIVSSLSRNDIVDVFEVSSNNWFRIGINRWVSGSTLYMQKLSEEETMPVSDTMLSELYFPCDERWPVTQIFGVRPYTYTIARGHNGIDYGIPVGNPIFAAADGVVIVSRAETTGYGRHIRIQHYINGKRAGVTIYGHMSRNDVSVGDVVRAKQVIGLSGGATSDPYSGMSTGPHLHFEYRWDKPAPQVPGGYVYNAVDPKPLLRSHEDGDALFRAKCIVDSLRIRIRPSADTTSLIVGNLSRDQVVNVYQVSLNGWFRIGINRWCSGHPNYMLKIGVGETPIPPVTPDPVDPPADLRKEVVMSGHLIIRKSPQLDAAPTGKYALRGNTYRVYQISDDNWYLLADGWISGNTQYTELRDI